MFKSLSAMLNDLFPYIWPKSRNDIKSRFIIALIIILIGLGLSELKKGLGKNF